MQKKQKTLGSRIVYAITLIILFILLYFAYQYYQLNNFNDFVRGCKFFSPAERGGTA